MNNYDERAAKPVNRKLRMGDEFISLPLKIADAETGICSCRPSSYVPRFRGTVNLTAEERAAVIEENKRRGTFHLLRLGAHEN